MPSSKAIHMLSDIPRSLLEKQADAYQTACGRRFCTWWPERRRLPSTEDPATVTCRQCRQTRQYRDTVAE